MATAAASSAGPRAAVQFAYRTGLLLLAIACLGAALYVVFPSGPWLYPAALSINGAACVAHGITLNFRLSFLTGFFFSILGGIQLGIVLILATFVR
jgi:hypothetical protein